jgi:NAD-dependent deacetylase
VVSPANLLPEAALNSGAKMIIVNKEETHVDKFANVVLRGRTGEILPKIVEMVKSIRT